jgi:hypothetical protein
LSYECVDEHGHEDVVHASRARREQSTTDAAVMRASWQDGVRRALGVAPGFPGAHPDPLEDSRRLASKVFICARACPRGSRVLDAALGASTSFPPLLRLSIVALLVIPRHIGPRFATRPSPYRRKPANRRRPIVRYPEATYERQTALIAAGAVGI